MKNRFLIFFDDMSKEIETRLKEVNLALEDVPLLKDEIFVLERELAELTEFKIDEFILELDYQIGKYYKLFDLIKINDIVYTLIEITDGKHFRFYNRDKFENKCRVPLGKIDVRII